MNRERWEDVKESIREKFEISDQGREALEGRPGTVDFVEFTTPAGKFRLEYIDTARATGYATSDGKKVGTASRIVRTFSADESVTRLDAYRWSGSEWVAFDASAFA